ncbi:hypothetical protein [Aeromonas sp. s10]|uniref:hypothetical protein n=1 Tax=Aeromonas sp. s10 TaxID=3138480 RepID=UPI0034A48018
MSFPSTAFSPAAAVLTPVTTAFPISGLSQDVVSDIVDLAFHGSIFEVRMQYSTKAWNAAALSRHLWTELAFPPNPRSSVPKQPGVYVFIVRPKLFGLFQTSGLLYVGKATNLYERVGAYISEVNKRHSMSNRPHIWRMLNVWNGHLHYIYTTTPTVADAENLEERMLEALLPYFNKEFPAETSRRQRAFP